jgi:hypothetical protein
MGIGKLLGSISPMAGAITGKGTFGGLRKITPVMMAIDAARKKKAANAPMSSGRPMVDEVVMAEQAPAGSPMMRKKGGKVKAKKMAAGGSASKRADGCATKGKTKGKFV